MDRRTRSIVVSTALAVLVTGAGLPPAASAQSPSTSAPPVILPDLSLPADASLAADASVVVEDVPGTLAGPIDADAAIDDALATADALPETAWELGALAETLGDDPVAAFRFVRDRIGFEPYPGILRGAEGTLAARAGNAWDRALLLRALIEASERAGIWTLQGSIFPENAASLALVRACGFREVGRRERIGCMDGVWRDTILVERRSQAVE